MESKKSTLQVELTPLTSVSPIDGRYWRQSSVLSDYFSEFGLIRYRVMIEVEYFIHLSTVIPALSSFKKEDIPKLKNIYKKETFNQKEANVIKECEKKTNHDVKAVEYYLKDKFDELGLSQYKEWLHFGLTSQDINNTAIPLHTKEALETEYYPLLERVISLLYSKAESSLDVPMLAHTHGQPATPTRMGKELMVFVYRVRQQLKQLKSVPHSAKFGGATGQLNAHVVAFKSGIDWLSFADKFVESLGLEREQWTTQISNYDNLASLLDSLKRINTILMDLCKDVWQYISMHYFSQTIVSQEVGSSAMPHKVNPIDFENAEGNFGLANSLFEHLASKLPISRLQRDLTDSTVLRNLGVPFAHTFIALQSLEKGLNKLKINKDKIQKDLNDNYIVVSEAIQTVLRREGYPEPYEALKSLTRTGDDISKQSMDNFIDTLKVNDSVKKELKDITPFNFIGVVPDSSTLK